MDVQIQKGIKIRRRKKFWSDVVRDRQLYFMLFPFLLYYLVFMYSPMYGIQIAFKDFKPFLGIWDSKWIGFTHFENFFSSPYAWRVIRNTLMINVYDVLFHFTLTIVFALLINEITHKRLKSFVQTVIYMPHFVSIVVVAGLVITLLSPTSGAVNLLVEKLGGERIYFLAFPEYFRTIFVSMQCWMGIGFGTIIYTSAICSIDESLYEAADIDGASRLRKMWHITLPGIKTTIIVSLILRMGNMMNVGSDSIILLYQPITYETADVISSFVYRYGMEGGQLSFTTAVGLFNGLVSMILVLCTNMISKRVSEQSLW